MFNLLKSTLFSIVAIAFAFSVGFTANAVQELPFSFYECGEEDCECDALFTVLFEGEYTERFFMIDEDTALISKVFTVPPIVRVNYNSAMAQEVGLNAARFAPSRCCDFPSIDTIVLAESHLFNIRTGECLSVTKTTISVCNRCHDVSPPITITGPGCGKTHS